MMTTLQRSRFLLRFCVTWMKHCQGPVQTIQQVSRYKKNVYRCVWGVQDCHQRYLTTAASTSDESLKQTDNDESSQVSKVLKDESNDLVVNQFVKKKGVKNAFVVNDDYIKTIYNSKSVLFIAENLKKCLSTNKITEKMKMKVIMVCLGRLLSQDLYHRDKLEQLVNDKTDMGKLQKFVKTHLDDMPLESIQVVLKFLLQNLSADSPLLDIVLNEGIWRVRKISMEQTFKLIQIIQPHQTTDRRKELFQICKEKVQLNIGDITSPKVLISAMYLFEHDESADSAVVREQLRSAAQPLVDKMHQMQVYRVLHMLATMCKKGDTIDQDLMKKVVTHLNSRPINFDEKKIRNLFSACVTLNIHDPVLIQDLTAILLDILQRKNDSTIMFNITHSVLFSCSKLGFSDTKLTGCLLEDLKAAFTQGLLSDWQCASIVSSIANLNLVDYRGFAVEIAQSSKSLKMSNSGLWLNIIHSLASLNIAESALLQEVLHEDFYRSLLQDAKDKPDYVQANIKTKLLNIYGCLREDMEVKEESVVPSMDVMQNWQDSLQEMANKTPANQLQAEVADVLNCIAPLENYVKKNIVNRYGHKLEFEIFIDENGKARRLGDENIKKRIGIQVLGFKEMIRGSGDPVACGSSIMARRHLQNNRDAVIMVLYQDWTLLTSKISQIHYLEDLIKQQVNKSPADNSVSTN